MCTFLDSNRDGDRLAMFQMTFYSPTTYSSVETVLGMDVYFTAPLMGLHQIYRVEFFLTSHLSATLQSPLQSDTKKSTRYLFQILNTKIS